MGRCSIRCGGLGKVDARDRVDSTGHLSIELQAQQFIVSCRGIHARSNIRGTDIQCGIQQVDHAIGSNRLALRCVALGICSANPEEHVIVASAIGVIEAPLRKS